LADLIDKCNRVVEERGYRFSSDEEEHSDAILSVGYFKILVCLHNNLPLPIPAQRTRRFLLCKGEADPRTAVGVIAIAVPLIMRCMKLTPQSYAY